MAKEWTPERAAELAERAERGFDDAEIGPAIPNPLRKPGRPALSPEGSKALNARIPSDLHAAVVALARDSGRSVSDVTRDALAAFLDDHHAEAG